MQENPLESLIQKFERHSYQQITEELAGNLGRFIDFCNYLTREDASVSQGVYLKTLEAIFLAASHLENKKDLDESLKDLINAKITLEGCDKSITAEIHKIAQRTLGTCEDFTESCFALLDKMPPDRAYQYAKEHKLNEKIITRLEKKLAPGLSLSNLFTKPQPSLKEIIDQACEINQNQTKLSEIENLTKEHLEQLAPYLSYVNCRGEPFNSWESEKLKQFIEKCSNLEHLYIDSNNITSLPELPKCRKLNCVDCENLESLLALPKCEKLICSFCRKLQSLPKLPKCELLNCRSCNDLQIMPALPKCKELDCRFCHKLQSLPALPNCQVLDCSACINLESLPNFSDLTTRIYCIDCPRLDINFARSATCSVDFGDVVSSILDHEGLRADVDRKDFETKEGVQKRLIDFANSLSSLKKEKIRLFVHFAGEAGIDYGGLAKEFLRLLIQGALKEGLFLKDGAGNFLCKKDFGDSQEKNLENLELLGRILMAACLSTNTREHPWEDKLITGVFFNDQVIDQMKVFSAEDLKAEQITENSKERLLEIFGNENPAFKRVINILQSGKSEEEKQFAKDYISGLGLEVEGTDWAAFAEAAMKPLKEHILEEHIDIKALHALGKGMFNYLQRTDEELESFWQTWQQIPTEEISAKIQGRFKREEIAKMLRNCLGTGGEGFQQKLGYLIQFVEDPKTKDREIKEFLAFVTGQESLPPKGIPLSVKEISRGAPFILPRTHGCSNQIELWHQVQAPEEKGSLKLGDDSYEHFLETLRFAIQNAKDFGNA